MFSDNIQEANNLIKDLDPSVPHEYILKGVVNASIGQMQGSRERLKTAQQYFQMIGGRFEFNKQYLLYILNNLKLIKRLQRF